MRRINAEIQGGKAQEYWRISSLSDAAVQYLGKHKIQDLVGGSIYMTLMFLMLLSMPAYEAVLTVPVGGIFHADVIDILIFEMKGKKHGEWTFDVVYSRRRSLADAPDA